MNTIELDGVVPPLSTLLLLPSMAESMVVSGPVVSCTVTVNEPVEELGGVA